MGLVKHVSSVAEIISDLERMGHDFAKGLTEQAHKDLCQSFDEIIDAFYTYPITSYHRHDNLRSSQLGHGYHVGGTHGTANFEVGAAGMAEVYRAPASWVFDLAWNQGIHGLPASGSNELSREFEWRGNYFTMGGIVKAEPGWYVNGVNMGMHWTNPYFSGSVPVSVSVGLAGYGAHGVPNHAMSEIVDHWDQVSGDIKADEIAAYIRATY